MSCINIDLDLSLQDSKASGALARYPIIAIQITAVKINFTFKNLH